MSVEQQDVVKPVHVHVTKMEAATAVGSGLLVGIGWVAAPCLAVGGIITGLGMGFRVAEREGYEKSRQRRELEKQGEITQDKEVGSQNVEITGE